MDTCRVGGGTQGSTFYTPLIPKNPGIINSPPNPLEYYLIRPRLRNYFPKLPLLARVIYTNYVLEFAQANSIYAGSKFDLDNISETIMH